MLYICNLFNIINQLYFNLKKNKKKLGNSLAVQQLGLSAFTVKGPGLIPGWGTKIPQACPTP